MGDPVAAHLDGAGGGTPAAPARRRRVADRPRRGLGPRAALGRSTRPPRADRWVVQRQARAASVGRGGGGVRSARCGSPRGARPRGRSGVPARASRHRRVLVPGHLSAWPQHHGRVPRRAVGDRGTRRRPRARRPPGAGRDRGDHRHLRALSHVGVLLLRVAASRGLVPGIAGREMAIRRAAPSGGLS